MRHIIMAIVACAAAGACMTSKPAQKSPRIRTAEGVATTLTLAGGDSIKGELLALDSAAVTLLAPRGIVVVRHGMVARAHFTGYRPLAARSGGYLVDKDQWERLVLESRYPYGIPAPALAAIMGARNQARVDTLQAP